MADNPTRGRLTCAMAGIAVRTLRERRGVSQERLGFLSGVDRPAIGGIERGVRWGLLHTYDRLLVGMGVTWAEFGAELDRLAGRDGK